MPPRPWLGVPVIAAFCHATEAAQVVHTPNDHIPNFAASCRNPVQQIVSGPGWKFIVPAAPYTARNPRFRGADMTDANQTTAVTPQHQPILEFRGNEVYGLAADGLTAGQLGTDGYGIMPAGMPQSVIKDFASGTPTRARSTTTLRTACSWTAWCTGSTGPRPSTGLRPITAATIETWT